MYTIKADSKHDDIMELLRGVIETYRRESDRRFIVKVDHIAESLLGLRFFCCYTGQYFTPDLLWMYLIGIFEFCNFPDLDPIHLPSSGALPLHVHVELCPHFEAVYNRLLKMGRLWEYDPLTGISQEFEDFMLLVDLHEAGETVLIEIED